MFCKKCSEKIEDGYEICPKCGSYIAEKSNKESLELDESKTGIGVLCGLFLGIIGLAIGLCLYKEGTESRKTFMKGWVIAFVSAIIIGIIFGIVYYINLSNQINEITNTYNDYFNDLYNGYY